MPRAATWAFVLVYFSLLFTLVEVSLQEAGRPPSAGIQTKQIDDAVVVTYALPAGIAWNSGIRPGDHIREADGRPARGMSPAELDAARSFALTRRSGEVLSVPEDLPDTPAKRTAFLIIAAGFAIVGAIVVTLIDNLALGSVFFAWTAVTAVALVTPIAETSGNTWAYVLETLAVISFGGSTLAVFLIFPVNRLTGKRTRWLFAAAELWHIALVAPYLYSVVVEPGLYEFVQRALIATLTVDIGVAIASVSVPLLSAALRRQKPAAANAVLVTGATAGLAPFLLLVLAPRSMGAGNLVPADTAILSLILLPMSLAATMGRLFTIHSWLRRGLIRLFVWTLLLIGYGLLLTAVQGLAANGGAILKLATSPFILVVIVGATLPVLERWLRSKLESALLQDVYSFPAALQQFASRIVHLRTAEDIADYTLASLGEMLDLRWAALVLGRPKERRFQWGPCPRDTSLAAAEIAPLAADGAELGMLAVGPKRHDVDLLPQDRVLIQTIAPLLAISLQLAWQLEVVAQNERDLETLSQKLLDVQEEVRRRIALELHDDAIQRAIHLAREFDERAQDAATGAAWRESVMELVIALRSVCVGLYPTVLDDLGLPAGLQQLVSEMRAKTDISADLLIDGAGGKDFGRLDRELELALYRIAQESLNNVRKHSSAQHVLVSLRRLENTVELVVADDGAAPALDSTSNELPVQPDLTPALGVVGMRHRLSRWGGSLTISDREEGGVQVQARAPLVGPPA